MPQQRLTNLRGSAHTVRATPFPDLKEATMATLETAADAILTDELLARFDERAPGYDAANRFFHEDFDELREAGYLDLAIPPDFGGRGLTLAPVGRLPRRLPYGAPTAPAADK